jgi:hypothetical protein
MTLILTRKMTITMLRDRLVEGEGKVLQQQANGLLLEVAGRAQQQARKRPTQKEAGAENEGAEDGVEVAEEVEGGLAEEVEEVAAVGGMQHKGT